MGEPYKKCTKVFDDAYKDCSRRLGVFDFVCGIVTATSHLCHIARIGELLCLLSAAIKTLVVDTIKEATIGTVCNGQLKDSPSVVIYCCYRLSC